MRQWITSRVGIIVLTAVLAVLVAGTGVAMADHQNIVAAISAMSAKVGIASTSTHASSPTTSKHVTTTETPSAGEKGEGQSSGDDGAHTGGSTTGSAAQFHVLSGTVASVQASANTFTMQVAGQTTPLTISFDAKTEITFNGVGHQPATVLAQGLAVRVEATQQGSTYYAHEIDLGHESSEGTGGDSTGGDHGATTTPGSTTPGSTTGAGTVTPQPDH